MTKDYILADDKKINHINDEAARILTAMKVKKQTTEVRFTNQPRKITRRLMVEGNSAKTTRQNTVEVGHDREKNLKTQPTDSVN